MLAAGCAAESADRPSVEPVPTTSASTLTLPPAHPTAAPGMPDRALTPGASFPGVGVEQVCSSGYSKRARLVLPEQYRAAYAAYGLSDVFDARLEVTARGYHYRAGEEQNPNALSAMVGVAYKLDVLRWVPWAGVYAGYLGFLDAPRAGLAFKRHDAALGLGLGLDYGISRKLGVGVTLRFDNALVNADARNFDALLRAEYRWGW